MFWIVWFALFSCSKKSVNDDGNGEVESGNGSKRRRANDENGENNVFEDDNEQADGETDITSSKIEYLDQLRKELAQHKQQNQLLMTRRNNVFKSMVTLHEMYETGLDGIARMNDLRFVPDNVMPENIPR